MTSLLTEDMKHRIDSVIEYIGTSTDNWLTVKYKLIRAFSYHQNGLFSCVNVHTRKQELNDFDKEVIEYWREKTGISLGLRPDQIHDPNYVYVPRVFAFAAHNERRRQAKRERELLNPPKPKRKYTHKIPKLDSTQHEK